MKKLYANLFLFALLVNIFGSVLVNGVHELVHIVNEPSTTSSHPHTEGSSAKNLAEDETFCHDHGHGHHHHGYMLTLLFKSFDYQKLTSLLQDFRQAIVWMLNFPSIIEDCDISLNLRLLSMIKNATSYLATFDHSTAIDIPTPPPRYILS